MAGWIRLIFGPVFESSPAKKQIAGVVNVVALALATSQLIAFFIPIYGGSASRRHILSGSAVAISLAALELVRRGRIREASFIIVVSVWLLLTAAATTAGGLHGPAFSAYVIPVMCAGLLLGFRAAIWTTGATICAGLFMLLAETRGFLPISSAPFTTPGLFITHATLLILVVALLRLSTHTISESLERARLELAEREQAEEALKLSESKFREFFEDSLTGDYISTPRGKLLACNPAFAHMFGFSSVEEALNCDTRSLYPNADYRQDLLARLKQHGRLERLETEFRRLDGSPLYVVQNAVGVFDADGELVEVKGYMFDITERRRLEEQFLQSQKMEAIGRLAGGVAHDFNNLLTVILSYSDLLLTTSANQPDSVRKYADRIKTASEHAASLTNQLLAFGRQQVRDVRVVDVNGVITGTLQILHRLIGEDVELCTRLDSGPIRARADAGQLQQVVMNLVVNGRDAMPNGGKLTIETCCVYLDEHWASQFVDTQPGQYVMLSVSDTGTGMDPDTRAHIFEPFFTTKERGKGTGLGLATVHGIVKQSGGQISVYTEPGLGTTFKIYLPRPDSPEASSKPAPAPPADQTGNETILLVEDEREVRRLVRNILETKGYLVIEAGPENAIQTSHDFPDDIHLLLTDVIMPRINGRELANRLVAQRPAMKVLYMSGYTDRIIMDRNILPSGVALLGKPFTLVGLVDKVREVLDGPQT
jgi:PAS domain S-box-containing protein